MAGTHMTRRSMLGTVGAASLAPVLPVHANLHAGPGTPDAGLPCARAAFIGRLQVSAMPSASTTQAVAITGGTLRGRSLAGTVKAGQIQWQPQPEGGVELVVHFDLHCADGELLQVHERGLIPAGTDITQGAAINATAEVLGADGLPCARSSLLVGRIDTTQLHAGVVRLQAFEVS